MDIAQTRCSLLRLFLLVAVLCSLTGLSAQLYPGRVAGRIQDAQGAVVPGAAVKLTNPATGLERSVISDANGEFNFPELALGSYQLSISKAGFETTVVTDIRTSQGQVNTLNPVLKVGSVSTEIEVSSMPALIQTETNSAGGQLSQEQVNALPLGNSDYTRLALTLPGANTPSTDRVPVPTHSTSTARRIRTLPPTCLLSMKEEIRRRRPRACHSTQSRKSALSAAAPEPTWDRTPAAS